MTFTQKLRHGQLLRILGIMLVVSLLLTTFAACAPPGKNPEVDQLQVPLRWCALEGTTAVNNPEDLGEINTDEVLWRRQERASDNIWIPYANITFRSAIGKHIVNQANFPIIVDPHQDSLRYLFSISQTFAQELDALDISNCGAMCEMSQELRTEFQMHEEMLSDSPAFDVVQLGVEWNMINGDKLYILVLENQAINVYLATFGPGEVGDVFIGDLVAGTEVNEVIAVCEAAWDSIEVEAGRNLDGIIAVNIGGFVNANGVPFGQARLGIAVFDEPFFSDPSVLETVCRDPSNFPTNTGAAVIITDLPNRLNLFPHEKPLAHELGHALFLGHGNGRDDNANGLIDEYCDDFEDPSAQPESLMCPGCLSEILTSEQVNIARQVALRTPGTVIDPPAILLPVNVVSDQRVDSLHDVSSQGLDIVWVNISENSDQDVTVISFKLLGLIPDSGQYQYSIFIDLDGNSETGGMPDELGFESKLSGIEVIVHAAIDGVSRDILDYTTKLYIASDGNWSEESTENVRTFISTAVEAELRIPLFNKVNFQIPTELIGQSEGNVNFQAIVEDLTTGEQDFLPDGEGAEFATLFMEPPEYPSCVASPANPQPGDKVTLEVFDLWPNQDIEVFLGDTAVAAGETDDVGQAAIEFMIPFDARREMRLVTVGVVGTAVTADCFVSLEIPPTVTPISIEIPTVTPTSIGVPSLQITPIRVPGLQITPPGGLDIDVTTD